MEKLAPEKIKEKRFTLRFVIIASLLGFISLGFGVDKIIFGFIYQNKWQVTNVYELALQQQFSVGLLSYFFTFVLIIFSLYTLSRMYKRAHRLVGRDVQALQSATRQYRLAKKAIYLLFVTDILRRVLVAISYQLDYVGRFPVDTCREITSQSLLWTGTGLSVIVALIIVLVSPALIPQVKLPGLRKSSGYFVRAVSILYIIFILLATFGFTFCAGSSGAI